MIRHSHAFVWDLNIERHIDEVMFITKHCRTFGLDCQFNVMPPFPDLVINETLERIEGDF